MKLTAREKHNQKQLMRVISYALVSKLRNLQSFSVELSPATFPADGPPVYGGHDIVVVFRDRHWVHAGVARSIAARNRRKKK